MNKLLLIFLLIVPCTLSAQEKYKDVSLDFEKRAADLVSRMTLDEKATQMTHISSAIPRLGCLPITGGMNACMVWDVQG